ncbi:hypothetical protein R1flu_028090 [Riccia fluitans]|uniref:Uncharacterized protein n=1 Tax=Riccia fluitans TaxID=41844 RepID=A0ABD1XKN9_9MARC
MTNLIHCSRCSHQKPMDAFIQGKGGNSLVKKRFRTCHDCYKRFARYEGNDDPSDDEIPATHCEIFKCQHSALVDEIRDIFDIEEMDRNVCAQVFVDLEEETKAMQLPAELHPTSWSMAHVIPDLECGSLYYCEVRKGYVIDEKHCKFNLLL